MQYFGHQFCACCREECSSSQQAIPAADKSEGVLADEDWPEESLSRGAETVGPAASQASEVFLDTPEGVLAEFDCMEDTVALAELQCLEESALGVQSKA